jgi:hypothetical protein
MEAVYKRFDKKIKKTNVDLDDIIGEMKIMYKKHTLFKYVFEKYYSCSRNPFTTAYSQFMHYLNMGYKIELTFNYIIENIIERMEHEHKHGIYTVYDN